MNKHNYYFLKKIYVILIITFCRFTKQSWHMLAYIANFVKSLSLTFLTQPPHFEAIVGQFVMETQKKKRKSEPIPTLHACTSCFIQGGGQDGERTLHLCIVFWSNDLLFIRLKFITPFCHLSKNVLVME